MNAYDPGLLVLRLCLGPTMAAHGYNKIAAPGGLAGTASWFDGIGTEPGRWHARIAAGSEIGFGPVRPSASVSRPAGRYRVLWPTMAKLTVASAARLFSGMFRTSTCTTIDRFPECTMVDIARAVPVVTARK